ncbi:hypothetical protein ABMA28_011332 [Loxostege sticticalis]|uniref:PiggyBac transposable element-derived protein domain-containing protein n=1 Tax=Loxostege sticticalis TaxID=481309 RepID=A0ABD0S969_LOXSC
MTSNDAIIERWLEQELATEDDLQNAEYSDVDVNFGDDFVLGEQSGSDSEIDGDEVTDSVVETTNFVPQNTSLVLSSSDEDDIPLEQLRSRPRKRNYFGKNRFRWSSLPASSRTRTLQHNIVKQKEGVQPAYKDLVNSSSSPLDIWSQFFTDEMLEVIVLHTNEKLQTMRPNYKKQSCVRDLDIVELKAFIGMLFYTAVFKENHEHYKSWYSTDGTGREIYRCVMSKNRFEVLLIAIRFDDSSTREIRRETDASAPISQLFDAFIRQCRNIYAIGSDACVDEMLVGFRGRCRFKMYMPKKPNKYGLKILCLTDARTGYLLNAYIYTGKDSDGLNLPTEYSRLKKPTQAVMRLVSCIEGTNRNVTTDNWFTSIELVNMLKEKQLTLVGTMRKNQRDIPPEFLPSRQRPVESSIFGFTKDITMTSFVPQQNKAVVLVSSMHHTPDIDQKSKKPEIILFYNKTKIGVDLLDQRCANYSTSRRTRRWPLAIFYRLLDISASNSYVVYLSTQLENTESRFTFMKRLAGQLTRPHMERREKITAIQRDIRFSLRRVLNLDTEALPGAVGSSSEQPERLTVRKYCSQCDPKKKRKTQYMCCNCKNPFCLECSHILCGLCRVKL